MPHLQALTIDLKCRTPLWLGDIDRDSASIKESGFIGSLRFWFEGTLRSYGVPVCNPTGKSEDRCPGKNGKYCHACQLFGATGLARAFRLEVSGLEPTPVFFRLSQGVANISGNWLWNIFGAEDTGGKRDRIDRGQTKFGFGVHALWSPNPFRLTITPRPGKEELVYGLFSLALMNAVYYGGIGAKTQYGFGQVDIVGDRIGAHLKQLGPRVVKARNELEDYRASAEAGAQESAAPRSCPENETGHFTLHKDRFLHLLYAVPESALAQIQWADVGQPPGGFDWPYIPCAFDIRYKYSIRNPRTGQGIDRGLRPEIRDHFGEDVACDVFGAVDRWEARASRVHVSHLFRKEPRGPYYLKIWGDVGDKPRIEKVIKEHIEKRFPGAKEVSRG